MWSAYVLHLAICGRACNICEFAINVEDVELPPKSEPAQWDPDGFPNCIFLKIRQDKGNKNGVPKKKQNIYLSRNRLNADICPVVVLLHWLLYSKLTYGPLHPSMDRGHTTLHHGIHQSESCYTRWLEDMFAYVGHPLLSSHSIRKSVVSWAARCGAQTPEIVAAGRWSATGKECSANFFLYYQSGEFVAKRWLGPHGNGIDPVWSFWVWTGISFRPNNAAP